MLQRLIKAIQRAKNVDLKTVEYLVILPYDGFRILIIEKECLSSGNTLGFHLKLFKTNLKLKFTLVFKVMYTLPFCS